MLYTQLKENFVGKFKFFSFLNFNCYSTVFEKKTIVLKNLKKKQRNQENNNTKNPRNEKKTINQNQENKPYEKPKPRKTKAQTLKVTIPIPKIKK